jgi:DNA-binding transcriptional regulator YiaG
VDHLRSGAPIEEKYTRRRVVLELQPRTYSARQVKETRKLLNASQALFAQFLGVSATSVRSWEQGVAPSGMARRFMDEIRRDPQYWRSRLKESLKVRGA